MFWCFLRNLEGDHCVRTEHKRFRFHNCRITQDATDAKQKAVKDYKEQVHRPPPLPQSTGKLKTGESKQPQRT